MPDIFDSLREVPARPLPAAEVRRLGDRRRRRTAALAAGAAVLAVMAVVLPFALSGSEKGAVAPVTPPAHEWVTTIPESFPLSSGMLGKPRHLPGTGPTFYEPIEACGDQSWTQPVVGMAAARDPSAPGNPEEARALALYRDDAEAQSVMAARAAAVDACPAPVGYDSRVLVAAKVGDATYAFVDDTDGGLITTLYVRVGNAVLTDQETYTGIVTEPYNVVQDLGQKWIGEMQTQSAGVIRAMCAFFSTDGCADPTAESTSSGGGSENGLIPDDFPIDADPLESADTTEGPGLVETDPPAPCGTPTIGASAPTDRLGYLVNQTERREVREVRLFESTEVAGELLRAMSAAVAACPEDAVGAGGATAQWLPLTAEGGEETAAFARFYDSDEDGGTVYVYLRVGAAILGVENSGRMRTGDLQAIADDAARRATAVVAAMARLGDLSDQPNTPTERGSRPGST